MCSQALRSHGADFTFAAGQVQGGKMLYSRLVRTFALAHVRPSSNAAGCARSCHAMHYSEMPPLRSVGRSPQCVVYVHVRLMIVYCSLDTRS